MTGVLFTLSLFSVTVIRATTIPTTAAELCEKAPPHAQPADAYYKLGVAGDPDLFLPGELYTVSLQGVDSGQGPTPFIGFTIWAELEEVTTEVDKVAAITTPLSNQSLGTFQAYDAHAKLHEFCKPGVENATAHSKTEIQVIWSAPANAADICVRLCALANQGENKTTPSILARKLCAAPAAPASFTRQPPIVEPCCACDEAKYEVTFESIWSRNTHPREFPPESARAHFSDLIGASHTARFRVWQEGRLATMGLRRLADDGTTTALEKELKGESDHIRTIIKARGISWQQVAGRAGIPNTFAVFRVDAKHHLVSLAAKLAPSPDWIVGVSALELCNVNCTWRTSITLPLYPYDAGTDSGLGYTSRRQPTVPPAPVRALRPDWPRDVRSPFFSTTGEMRPFAKLRLTRLRLYEKSCDNSDTGNNQESRGSNGGACALHAWGEWGPCSVTCGLGRKTRQRHYVFPARANAEACRAPLTDYSSCYGPRRHCRAVSEYEPDPAEATGPCAVSEWSEWSPCEGCGVRARTREYLVPRARKRCHVGFRARMVMSQAMPCDAGPCERPVGALENSTNFDWFFVDIPRGECAVSAWSDWSPCSAQCGRGRRLRTRVYLTRDARVQQQLSRRLLHDWSLWYARLRELDMSVENITSDDPEVESQVEKHLERCQFTLTQQEALCDALDNTCQNTTLPPEYVCTLPASVGPCRAYVERWFYDAMKAVCEPFGFTGCGGNANNFPTEEECQRKCKGIINVATTPDSAISTAAVAPAPEMSTKKVKTTQSPADNEVLQNDAPGLQDVDCEIGPWLGWSNCFGECNFAIKLNYRRIVRRNSGTGNKCPKLIKSRTCTPDLCNHTFTVTPTPNDGFNVELHYDDD
ncbi:spondin-1-like [Hyposmocoma kahamanoa]|uniref:spondin-1-like n=1 Tax=Hyposmocoma kahamanoa TaxID=1477025 RepID=UPI000E6D7253|nr:spondin-1-like [Hyposmocoma kahamanoa]